MGEAVVGRVGARFDLELRLKAGNGVETYAGVDAADGSPVVVKTVATAGVSTPLQLRLEHEAYVLERLGTAAFRPLVASGYDDGRFFLVQPRVAGQPLADRLALGPLSLDSALRVASTSSAPSSPGTTRACSTATPSRPTSSWPAANRWSGRPSSTSAWPAAPGSTPRCGTSRSAPPATSPPRPSG